MLPTGGGAPARSVAVIALCVAALAAPHPRASDGREIIGNDDLARIRLEIVGQPPRDPGTLGSDPAVRGSDGRPPRLEVGRLTRDAHGRLLLPLAIRVPGGAIAGFDESQQSIRFEFDGNGGGRPVSYDPASLLQDVRVSDDGGTVHALLGVPAAGEAGIVSMAVSGTFRIDRAASRLRASSRPVPIRAGEAGTIGPLRYRFDRILPEGDRSRSVWVRVESAGSQPVHPLAVALVDPANPDAEDGGRAEKLGDGSIDVVLVLDRTVRSAHVEIDYLRAPTRLEIPFRITARRAAAPSLEGLWQLRTPAGFISSVRLTRTEDGRYRFPGSTRFSGAYELQDETLVCVRPYHPRLRGFVWRVEDERRLVLVEQPDPSRVGGTYLGSVMRR